METAPVLEQVGVLGVKGAVWAGGIRLMCVRWRPPRVCVRYVAAVDSGARQQACRPAGLQALLVEVGCCT